LKLQKWLLCNKGNLKKEGVGPCRKFRCHRAKHYIVVGFVGFKISKIRALFLYSTHAGERNI